MLIGIVKKNAIMMIDFALEAQRNEGKTPRGRDLRGLPGALPADHDDDDGRADGQRCRSRSASAPAAIAPAARPGGGRRPVVSQLLTLYITPVIYLYFERLRAWRATRGAHAVAAQSPAD